MSYKDVFDVFKRERRLNDDETALLNTLRSMTDAEREQLAETLNPFTKAKSAKPATKKFKKCDVCGVSKRAAHHRDVDHPDYHVFDEGAPKTTEKKSARASSLAEKVKGATSRERPDRCVAALPNGAGVCGLGEVDVLHRDSTYGNHHPFVSSSTALPAPGQSSTNGGDQSSATAQADVSVASGG